MDYRFPNYLRRLVQKLGFIDVPNLGMLLAGLAILGFVGENLLGAPMERFVFDPNLVLRGEWWRLFTFPVSEAPSNPIFLLFYCLYVYFIMNAMEGSWGSAPLTLFTLLSYLCALSGSFLLGEPAPIWKYVVENISLAFGSLFPNIELQFFGIIPIKAKYLALVAAVFILLEFVGGGALVKLFLLIVFIPYLLFFGPMLYGIVRGSLKSSLRKKKFKSDMWK